MTWQTQAEARAIVADRVQIAKAPVLTSTDLDNCLLRTAHAVVWTPSTTLAYRARVLPTVRNGFYFTVSLGGQTGVVEPVWPVIYGSVGLWNMGMAQNNYSQIQGFLGGITDGNLFYVASAPDFDSPWDLEAATYEAWMMKAAKSSDMVNSSADGQSLSAEAVYQHCIDMAHRWAPITIG